jgi:hypothetical protein
MKFERRLRALEAKMISAPVVLLFGEGTERAISGGRHFLVRLLHGVCQGTDLGTGHREQLDLIRQCAGSSEPGGGRVVERIQCLLHAQADAHGGLLRDRWSALLHGRNCSLNFCDMQISILP